MSGKPEGQFLSMGGKEVNTQWGIHTNVSDEIVFRAQLDYMMLDFVGFTHKWRESVYTALLLVGEFEYPQEALKVPYPEASRNSTCIPVVCLQMMMSSGYSSGVA